MVGERLRALRREAGMTLEQVATACGVTRQAVAKWEAGTAAPGLERLPHIAAALGTTVPALFSDEAAS